MRSTETSSVGTKTHFHCAPSTGETTLINPSRNALRAKLVDRAEDWQWSSLWRRERGNSVQKRWLGRWPMPLPRRWLEYVNDPGKKRGRSSINVLSVVGCLSKFAGLGVSVWLASIVHWDNQFLPSVRDSFRRPRIFVEVVSGTGIPRHQSLNLGSPTGQPAEVGWNT
jgi:hypothetical protein